MQAFNIVSNILFLSVMPGGDFDGQMDYLEQFGSSTVSVSIYEEEIRKWLHYLVQQLSNISDFQCFTKTLFIV